MKWFFILLLFFVIPQVVFGAYQSGLVSCTGADCNFCDVAKTIGNIITFLFKLLTIIAVLVLVYAGFTLVTSAGNPSALEEAKGMFSNVIIGFVIIISAWLVVDTVMKALVDSDSGFGVWNEFSVNCGGLKEPALTNEQASYCANYPNDPRCAQ
jgi:hypothetical protein